MNFFDHKDPGNHLLQLCPKVVKHPVYRNMDLRKMRVNNWKQKAQEMKPWRGIIEQAKTHTEL